jgi:hypothetical protein
LPLGPHRRTQRRGGGGKVDCKFRTPQTNFKTLFNKNAIKPEIGGPPLAFFQESLDPPGILAKT